MRNELCEMAKAGDKVSSSTPLAMPTTAPMLCPRHLWKGVAVAFASCHEAHHKLWSHSFNAASTWNCGGCAAVACLGVAASLVLDYASFDTQLDA